MNQLRPACGLTPELLTYVLEPWRKWSSAAIHVPDHPNRFSNVPFSGATPCHPERRGAGRSEPRDLVRMACGAGSHRATPHRPTNGVGDPRARFLDFAPHSSASLGMTGGPPVSRAWASYGEDGQLATMLHSTARVCQEFWSQTPGRTEQWRPLGARGPRARIAPRAARTARTSYKLSGRE